MVNWITANTPNRQFSYRYILINTCVITTATLCLETKKHLHMYLAQPIAYHWSHTILLLCSCSPSPNTTQDLRQVKFITKKTFLVCTADQSLLQNVSFNGYGTQQLAVHISECLYKLPTGFIKAALLTRSLYNSSKKWERGEGKNKSCLPLWEGKKRVYLKSTTYFCSPCHHIIFNKSQKQFTGGGAHFCTTSHLLQLAVPYLTMWCNFLFLLWLSI